MKDSSAKIEYARFCLFSYLPPLILCPVFVKWDESPCTVPSNPRMLMLVFISLRRRSRIPSASISSPEGSTPIRSLVWGIIVSIIGRRRWVSISIIPRVDIIATLSTRWIVALLPIPPVDHIPLVNFPLIEKKICYLLESHTVVDLNVAFCCLPPMGPAFPGVFGLGPYNWFSIMLKSLPLGAACGISSCPLRGPLCFKEDSLEMGLIMSSIYFLSSL